MSSALTTPRISNFLSILFSFFLLLTLPRFVEPQTQTMDSLPSHFTIELNGSSIANIKPDAEDRAQAVTGPDAAVFTLNEGKLQCGDWLLARPSREDRSFLPKPVRWFKIGSEGDKLPVQPVTVEEDGNSYKIKFASEFTYQGLLSYLTEVYRCTIDLPRRRCICGPSRRCG